VRIQEEAEKKPKEQKKLPDFLIKPKEDSNITNLDHILSVTGNFGMYQKIQFLLVGLLAILPSMVAYAYVFVSATPPFTCRLVSYKENINIQNLRNQIDFDTNLNLVNVTLPADSYKLIKSEYFVESTRYLHILKDVNFFSYF
jgi:hypothetical protein